MMKRVITILLFIIITSSRESRAQSMVNHAKFRIIGYLLANDITAGNASTFDFSKITHLNIAFVNPDTSGNFQPISGLDNIVAAAHRSNVKVLMSLGGGSAPSYYSNLLRESNRNQLIRNIIQYISSNQLDGADVDLEGSRIDSNYERFVITLSTALKRKHKLVSAAIATVYKTAYSNKALAVLDFVNIMSYDKTGPWDPVNPGQHSPFEMAVEDLNYWKKSRCIKTGRINLGVPFYGYGFGQAPSDMSYGDIVNTFKGAENTDQVNTPTGGIIYYNGMHTISAKTLLALKDCGGIMIWQLLQDDYGNKSLLNIIDSTLTSK